MKDLVEQEQDSLDIFERHPVLLELMGGEAEYDFENCVTRASANQPYEEIDVAAALILSRGNVSLAARLLGRSRRSLHGHVLRNLVLSDLLEDIQDIKLDMIEDKASQMAIAGDGALIKYILGTRGKDRGYVTRVENTGKDGAPLNPIVTYELPDNGRDTKIEQKGNVVSISQMQREGSEDPE